MTSSQAKGRSWQGVAKVDFFFSSRLGYRQADHEVHTLRLACRNQARRIAFVGICVSFVIVGNVGYEKEQKQNASGTVHQTRSRD